MLEDLTPLPAALLVAALLQHVTEHLEAALPAPYAVVAVPEHLVLLHEQRVVATSAVRVPDGPLDPVVLLRDTAQEVLQEIQNLIVTSVRVMWPDLAAHAVSQWDDDGRLHLGYPGRRAWPPSRTHAAGVLAPGGAAAHRRMTVGWSPSPSPSPSPARPREWYVGGAAPLAPSAGPAAQAVTAEPPGTRQVRLGRPEPGRPGLAASSAATHPCSEHLGGSQAASQLGTRR